MSSTQHTLTLAPGNKLTLYAHAAGSKVTTTETLAQMLQKLGKTPALNHTAINHLLHHGAAPYPLSVFKGIHTLGLGDTATLTSQNKIRITNSIPYLPAKTRKDQTPNARHLLDLLSQSVTQGLGKQKGALMMSSGKDSVAIALAIKNAGLAKKVTAITYGESGPNSEAEVAAYFAKKFGLKHHSIPLPTDAKIIRAAMDSFFTASAQPIMDPVTVAYVLCLHQASVKNAVLMDGTGPDYYIGMLPPPNKKYVDAATLGRFNLFRALNEIVPIHAKLAKYLRTPADQVMLGRLALRQQDLRTFYPHATPTHTYWNELSEDPRLQGSYKDFFGHIRGYLYDGAHVSRSREELAHAGHNKLVLPWLTAELAEYNFNLPAKAKYNLATNKNKLLVRSMLKQFGGYDADAIGKRIFSFNQPKFLLENRAYVTEQILACTLFTRQVEPFITNLYNLLPTHEQVRYPLMQLFLLSGWHNHSKYLGKSAR